MTKRLAVVAGPLVVLMLAFVAYTYLADRSTPAGQPALVEIDAQALEQIKEEFNRARVYAADATWSNQMPPATFVNGPVVGVAEDIAKAVRSAIGR
jgi:hypothetical protein